MPYDCVAFGDAITHAISSHETILQTLNRWMDFGGGRKLFYGVENFEGTEPKWDNTPLIFAKNHPDVDQMRRIEQGEINSVLEEMGGAICGKIHASSVTRAGQPRLASQISFFDPSLEARYNQGELSLSTGFFCTPGDDGHLQGKVRPNHVLVFVQDDRNQPRDLGAMFLNKQEDTPMSEAAITHAGRVISEKNKSRFKAIMDSLSSFFSDISGEARVSEDDDKASKNSDISWKTQEEEKKKKGLGADGSPPAAANKDRDEMGETDLKEKLDSALTAMREKDTAIANKDTEISNLKGENTALKNQVAAFEKEKQDAVWTALKNKLPKGIIPKPEDEPGVRESFEKDPAGFMNKILDLKMKPPTEEEGKTHTGEGSATPEGIGVFNAKTQAWE